MRAFCRGAHPAPGEALNTFVPSQLNHPDISKMEHDIQRSPIYRPEVTGIFRQLPFLRPSCFFVYGAKSHFFSSSIESRKDKLQSTGIAVGGSGGVENEAVKDISLEGLGHFAPFEKPGLVAEGMFQWLSIEMDRWRAGNDTQHEMWSTIGVRERAMVEQDTRIWAKERFSSKEAKARLRGIGKNKDSKAESKL